MEGEYVMIADTAVQFLPPNGPLVQEGLEQTVTHDLDGLPVQVFSAEHLAAIALQTGRAKDKSRVLQFVEEGVLNAEQFRLLIARHHLEKQWERFEQQFLEDAP